MIRSVPRIHSVPRSRSVPRIHNPRIYVVPSLEFDEDSSLSSTSFSTSLSSEDVVFPNEMCNVIPSDKICEEQMYYMEE